MSKKDQSFVLYAEFLKTNPTPTRQQTIDMLVEKLQMTAAGASTYASMVRNNNTPPVVLSPKNATPSPKKTQHKVIDEAHPTKSVVADDSSKVDKRPLYSKCYFKGDEMVFSSSHYNAEDAKNFSPSTSYTKKKIEGLDSFTIVGVPTDTDTVSFLKSKYKVIS